MGRTQKKTDKEILEKCCNLFWEKGYSQTSLKDIEKATDLRAGSVYHHFKSKEDLFEQVLDYYISTIVHPRLDQFLQTDKGDGFKNIRNVFESVVTIPCEYRWIGCLMTNSSVEMQSGPSIKEKIKEVFNLFEQGFLHQINRIPAMKKKSLKQRQQIAENLLVAMEGFFVLVRLGSGDRQLKKYINSILYVITAS